MKCRAVRSNSCRPLLTIVRDSLTIDLSRCLLLWLNWQLTLFVVLLAPAVALVMRVVSRRLDKLTRAHQVATDELAYVVEENVLAWRIVRLHGARTTQSARFAKNSRWLRRLMIKSATAAATSSPLTQLIAAVALSAVVVAGAVAERPGRRPAADDGRRVHGLRHRDADAGGAAEAPVGQHGAADARHGARWSAAST